MATRIEPFWLARHAFSPRASHSSVLFRLLFLLSISLGGVSLVSAQTSTQQYVYASGSGSPNPSGVSGFSKTSTTGALNPVPGSPFNERLEGGLVAIDGQGKFLFVLNPTSNDISMFQIDPATGALSEVPGSPFAAPPLQPVWFPPSQPLSIAAERSGQFFFVGYQLANGGDSVGPSAVASFAIDISGSSPVLRPVTSILLQGSPIKLLTDSKGLHLYAGLGIINTGAQVSGTELFYIDGTGNLVDQGLTAATAINFGFGYTIDPQDRFIFELGGLSADHVVTCVISPVDGTANTCGTPVLLAFGVFGEMVVESSGHFLYVPDSQGDALVFSVDQATGYATQVASLPGIILTKGSSVADPMGPYIYSTDPSTTGGGVHAYLVDQQTGNLTEIPGSPFNPGTVGCCQGLAISGNPVQAISGPAATIFPSTATMFTAVAGAFSSTQVFSIVNVGNQLLTISSISIVGPDASTFSQTNTCPAALSPNAHCSVSIDFHPPNAGSFTATLQINDNAPGSPQTLLLNGTGIPLAPGITFTPSLSFPLPPLAAVTQGSSSGPQVVTVISSGTGPLHLSGVSLGGPNPADFSFTNNCPATLAPSSNCSVSVVFTPIAPGQRTASLLISDDAPGAPQTVSLSGTAVAAVSGGAAPGASTTASVSAGQSAQYQLQLAPGPGFTGTVSLTCSGAPLGAVCQVPSSVAITNGNPAAFTATVTTTGLALLPPSTPFRFPPLSRVPMLGPLSLALLLLFSVLSLRNYRSFQHAAGRNRFALCGILFFAVFCATLGFAGCGGGSAAVTPPPVITPSGTSTITISLGATSSSGQPLQLQPIQLTLTVK